jgi:hypothetical protein
LQAKLAEKQSNLEGQFKDPAEDERAEQQRQEYAKRGISLVAYETENTDPYFTNLDEDAFRSNRFMYILRKEVTVFGNKGDIQLMSLAVVRDHCKVRFDGSGVYITAGKGETWRNGHPIREGNEEKLEIFDRIAMVSPNSYPHPYPLPSPLPSPE